jgi:predicted choloylglycine hydrolase
MNQGKKIDDFLSNFRKLSKDEQKEVMKKLIPEFYQLVMQDKSFMQEMMPQCMEMMKGMDFPMKEMMFKMMGGS